VIVAVPAVTIVTVNIFTPLTTSAEAGSVSLTSEVVNATVAKEFTAIFHKSSTAFTVTLNATPAVRAPGVPVYPSALPGEAVTPGSRTCSMTPDLLNVKVLALKADSIFPATSVAIGCIL